MCCVTLSVVVLPPALCAGEERETEEQEKMDVEMVGGVMSNGTLEHQIILNLSVVFTSIHSSVRPSGLLILPYIHRS